MVGSARGWTNAVRLVVGLALCALVVACSEDKIPLNWQDSVRAGLGDPDSLVSGALVTRENSGHIDVSTGDGDFLLVGIVDRAGGSLTAKAFMQWDLDNLPDGDIVSAHIEMHLNGVDEAQANGEYDLRIYRVLGNWDEDSLNAQPLPPVDIGTPLGEARVDTAGLASAHEVLTLVDLFESEDPDEDLLELVREWADDDTTNHGLMLRPRSDTERAFLRFFSSEGVPSGASATLLTPLLVLEIQGDDATTVSLQASEDAYVIETEGDLVSLPEDALLVSAGYVHHAMLAFELPAPLTPVAAGRPADYVIVRGMLELSVLRDTEWSLAEGETMTLSVYDAEVDWSQADPWPNTALGQLLDEVTVAAEDSTVTINIAPHLQLLHEGSGTTLVIQSEATTDELRSLVLIGARLDLRQPEDPPIRRGPVVSITYAPVQDRLGE
jgi:hypothetical protein